MKVRPEIIGKQFVIDLFPFCTEQNKDWQSWQWIWNMPGREVGILVNSLQFSHGSFICFYFIYISYFLQGIQDGVIVSFYFHNKFVWIELICSVPSRQLYNVFPSHLEYSSLIGTIQASLIYFLNKSNLEHMMWIVLQIDYLCGLEIS